MNGMYSPPPADLTDGQISVSQVNYNQLELRFPSGDRMLQNIVESLPYAAQVDLGVYHVALCFESASVLAGLEAKGMVSTDINTLLGSADQYSGCHDAVVLPSQGTSYPYIVWQAWRNGPDVSKMIPGGYTRKGGGLKWAFPAESAGVIGRLVAEGTFRDPHNLFPEAEAVVGFDSMSGEFYSYGDPRVEQSIERFFPEKDVVAAAREHGVDVELNDPLSEEVYRGELARHGDGIQPEGINIELFPYQKTSVAQLVERSGMGVFLAPGLGKTLIATAAGQELLNRGKVDRVLVCPPAAVSAQWEKEILRFVDDADVTRVHGKNKQERMEKYAEAANSTWVIVHHDLLDRDAEHVESLVPGSSIVFDEAHRGANWTTKRSKKMVDMAKKAEHRMALTGTPVLNSVSEWYTIMGRLAIRNLFGTGEEFCNRYQYPSQYHKGYEGSRRLDELAKRSQPHFIRWTKEHAAKHLPPLQVKHMPIRPDSEYRKLLVKAHVNADDELMNHYDHVDDSEAVGQMTAYGMLRALCTSPMLIHMSDSDGAKALVKSGTIPKVDGPKVDKVREIAVKMQERGERIVMFTFSREMVKLLADRFQQDGIRYVTYHGETSDKDRQKAVEAFTSQTGKTNPGTHEDPTVFLATDAAAEGLNLGRECATLLNIDLPWTAGRLDQRANRIHRVDGTHDSYLVVNMTIDGTVEDSILKKVESKAGIADVLFGERSADEITGRKKNTAQQRAIRDAVNEWRSQEESWAKKEGDPG